MLGYEFPQVATGDDANWVNAEIDVAAGGAASFRAAIRATLRTDELARFRDELRTLDSTMTGEAELRHLEDEIEVRIRLKRGKGTLQGAVRDHVGPELQFGEVEIDQSFVREALADFDALVREFPVR